MSASAIDRLFKYIEFVRNTDIDPRVGVDARVGFSVALVAAHGIYSCFTWKQNIIVAKKYKTHSIAGTAFMVSTTTNAQYEIPASLWYWQWNVPEIWNSIETGIEYEITYYGSRVPAFGTYPGIVNIQKI